MVLDRQQPSANLFFGYSAQLGGSIADLLSGGRENLRRAGSQLQIDPALEEILQKLPMVFAEVKDLRDQGNPRRDAVIG